MVQGITEPQPTFMENIKNMNFQGAMDNIRTMQINWVDVGMFGAMGVLSGFLFKKYVHMFIVCTILGLGLVAFLDHFGMIYINWNSVHGIVDQAVPGQDIDTVFKGVFAWMKVNVVLVVSFGIGFVAGYKVG